MTDKTFQNANKVLKSQLKQNKKDGLDVSESRQPIDPLDMEKLYTAYFLPGLAEGNTEVLLHKVFFDLLFHTGRRGKEGLRYLKKDSFKIKTSTAGTRYVEITFNEATKKNQGGDLKADNFHNNHAIIKEQPNDDLCPVNSFDHYMHELNSDVIWFFQKPSKDKKSFDKMHLGKNPLGDMMKTISKQAGLSKEYTNHQIRKTTATALARSGFSLKEIADVTKHKNLESLKYYIGGPSHDEKENYSDALHQYTHQTKRKSTEDNENQQAEPKKKSTKTQQKTKTKPTKKFTKAPSNVDPENAVVPFEPNFEDESDDEEEERNETNAVALRNNVVQNRLQQAANVFSNATFNNCTINLQMPK